MSHHLTERTMRLITIIALSLLVTACNLRSAKTVVFTAEIDDVEVNYPVYIEVYEEFMVDSQLESEMTFSADLYENGDQATWHNSETSDTAILYLMLSAQVDDGAEVSHIMRCSFESQKLIQEEVFCAVRMSGLTAYADCEPDICN